MSDDKRPAVADDIVTRLRNLVEWSGETLRLAAADEIAGLREQLRTTNGMLEAANYEVARLAIDLRDCRRGATRG